MRALILILFVALVACDHKPHYIIVENEVYDVPFKSQVSLRIVLKDSITKANVKTVLTTEFRKQMGRSMKHHNPPSHIFIFLYADTVDWDKNGAKWIGMKKRVMNENSPIDFSETLTK